MNIREWAEKWGVPQEALTDLFNFGVSVTHGQTPKSEAAIQQEIRLEASKYGFHMWRNNNGAAVDSTGRHIRYGLGNDSRKINEQFKSSDLIGITPITVRSEMVGSVIGVFTAVEVKASHWNYQGSAREQAQFRFIELVKSKGGNATFATSKEDYLECLTV